MTAAWYAFTEMEEWLTGDGKYVADNEWWKSVRLKSTLGPEQTVAQRNCWLKPHFSTTTSHDILNKKQNNNTHTYTKEKLKKKTAPPPTIRSECKTAPNLLAEKSQFIA